MKQKQTRWNTIVNGLEDITRGAGFWCAFVLLALFALNSLVATSYFDIPNTNEYVWYKTGGILPNLLALALFTLLLVVVLRKGLWRLPVLRHAEWLMVVFHIAIGVFWVFSAGARQYGEPERINQSASAFMNGEWYNLEEGGYNHLFPYQLGFTLYIELFYKIFGLYNMTAVSLSNVLYAAGCYLLLVKISRRMFPDGPVPFITTLLLFGSVYLVPYTTFNYAILPGLCLSLGGLLCALRYVGGARRPGWLVGAILCTATATVLKSNYLIFAVGIGILLVLDVLRRPRPVALALTAAFVLANLFGIQVVYGIYMLRSGVEIGSGVPKITWVAMGLKDDGELAAGWYNGDTYKVYPDNGYDTEKTRQAAWADIGERLETFKHDPAYAVDFFYRKISSEWNEPTYGSFMATWYAIDYGGGGGWVRRFFVGGTWASLTVALLDRLHFLTMAGAAYGLWARRKQLTLAQLIPAIIFVGGFLFFLVWEGKSQYVMPFAFLLVPYAAAGLAALAEKAAKRLGKATT